MNKKPPKVDGSARTPEAADGDREVPRRHGDQIHVGGRRREREVGLGGVVEGVEAEIVDPVRRIVNVDVLSAVTSNPTIGRKRSRDREQRVERRLPSETASARGGDLVQAHRSRLQSGECVTLGSECWLPVMARGLIHHTGVDET